MKSRFSPCFGGAEPFLYFDQLLFITVPSLMNTTRAVDFVFFFFFVKLQWADSVVEIGVRMSAMKSNNKGEMCNALDFDV